MSLERDTYIYFYGGGGGKGWLKNGREREKKRIRSTVCTRERTKACQKNKKKIISSLQVELYQTAQRLFRTALV